MLAAKPFEDFLFAAVRSRRHASPVRPSIRPTE
jgi:hypothetical protein